MQSARLLRSSNFSKAANTTGQEQRQPPGTPAFTTTACNNQAAAAARSDRGVGFAVGLLQSQTAAMVACASLPGGHRQTHLAAQDSVSCRCLSNRCTYAAAVHELTLTRSSAGMTCRLLGTACALLSFLTHTPPDFHSPVSK